MQTITLVLIGYLLAKFQVTDPFIFKLGIGLVFLLAALDYLGTILVKVTYKCFEDKFKK